MRILLKKLAIFILITVLALAIMFPIAIADAFSQSSAVGGDLFVMQHDNELHKHFLGLVLEMHNQGWTDSWVFTVTVFDFSVNGVGNDYIIFELSNSEVHHMEGTLTAGNIVIIN